MNGRIAYIFVERGIFYLFYLFIGSAESFFSSYLCFHSFFDLFFGWFSFFVLLFAFFFALFFILITPLQCQTVSHPYSFCLRGTESINRTQFRSDKFVRIKFYMHLQDSHLLQASISGGKMYTFIEKKEQEKKGES